MTKQAAIRRAEKNISAAQNAIRWAENRSGITEEEQKNLQEKLEYAEMVLELVKRYWD